MTIDTINRIYIPRLVAAPGFRVFRHALLLLVICFVLMNTDVNGEFEYAYGVLVEKIALFFIFTGIIYANLYLFVPRLLLKNKLGRYSFALTGCTLLFLFSLVVFQWLFHEVNQEAERACLYILLDLVGAFITIALIIACSTACLVFRNWIVDSEKIITLRKATLDIELQQLKNQINPHFLFNMLNNANMLLKKDRKQAAEVLLKLEELLCYQMRTNSKEEVDLNSEIDFLNDFLNLEKIRRDRFDFTLSESGKCWEQRVAPLLFIIFVENAVKHSVDNEHPSYVHASFKCLAGGELEFSCENSKPEQPMKPAKVGGLGLRNIRRRLDLLYPQRHRLEIIDETTKYTLKLTLTL